MAGNGTATIGIGAVESFRCRIALSRIIAHVTPAGGASAGRILAIGGGLERLIDVCSCREVVFLSEFDTQTDRLPERTRREPWPEPPTIPFADSTFSSVVVLDVLAELPCAQREAFLRECARVAEDAVIIASPVADQEVISATRDLNELHRGLRGEEHPRLSRQIAFGLPDLARTCELLSDVMPHISVETLGSVRHWRQLESLALMVTAPRSGDGMAESMLGGNPRDEKSDTAPYRHLLIASREPLVSPAELSLRMDDLTDGGMIRTLQMLEYVSVARCEREVASLSGQFDRWKKDISGSLSRELQQSVRYAVEERQQRVEALERAIRDMSDELRDIEAELSNVTHENVALRTERDNLQSTVNEQLQNALVESNALRHQIEVMEATRGWKLLVGIRKIRDAILGRG